MTKQVFATSMMGKKQNKNVKMFQEAQENSVTQATLFRQLVDTADYQIPYQWLSLLLSIYQLFHLSPPKKLFCDISRSFPAFEIENAHKTGG